MAGLSRERRRVLFGGLIAALCLAALIGIVGLLQGSFDEASLRVLIQALALLLFSATAIGATRVQERYPALAAAGVVTSAIGVLLASAGIWSRWWESGHETLWRWMWAFVVLPLVISHVSGLLARLRETDRPAVHTVTRLTVLAAGILGALIVVPVVAHAHVESGYVRFAGVFVILDVLGTLVVPILRRAARGA